MKKHLIALILLLTSYSFAYQARNTFQRPMYSYQPNYKIPYNNRFSSIYNPYRNYNYNPYYKNFNRTNYSNSLPDRIMRMIDFQKKKLNNVGFFNRNNGSLTGYSVPIHQDDIYKQMGIRPYDPKSKQKYNSINANQELFSKPSGNEIYYDNGEYYRDLEGVSTKSGVTIIYD